MHGLCRSHIYERMWKPVDNCAGIIIWAVPFDIIVLFQTFLLQEKNGG